MATPRMRTIPAAYAELKRLDENTAYTLTALRSAVKRGEIPVVRVGSKRLINLDILMERLNCADIGSASKASDDYGKIRRIDEMRCS